MKTLSNKVTSNKQLGSSGVSSGANITNEIKSNNSTNKLKRIPKCKYIYIATVLVLLLIVTLYKCKYCLLIVTLLLCVSVSAVLVLLLTVTLLFV